jgi:hypothetical protein
MGFPSMIPISKVSLMDKRFVLDKHCYFYFILFLKVFLYSGSSLESKADNLASAITQIAQKNLAKVV